MPRLFPSINTSYFLIQFSYVQHSPVDSVTAHWETLTPNCFFYSKSL